MSNPLREFVESAERIVRGSNSDAEALRGLKPLMARLLAGPDPIPQEVFQSRNDRFAMNLVYMPKDRVFSVNGAVWLPGQTTPIHDHLTWAVVGLHRGEERESIFRRTDDGSDPKRAELHMVREKVNGPGHITVLGKAGIHRIDNVSRSPSYSVHVYGIDIGNAERHSYDPATGEVSKFVSGYCNVLRDDDFA